MRNTERLERFWCNLIRQQKLSSGADLPGGVVTCWPDIPSFRLNHAAGIDVNEKDIDILLSSVTQHFLSRGVRSFGFRVSPLTRPESFASTLESRGFERRDEDSVMFFMGGRPGGGVDSDVDIREIGEEDLEVFNQVSLMAYESPPEWKEGFSRLFRHRMRMGGRHYLAHVDGVAVGTCALLSLARIGGIFSVGTLKEHRGQGIATAMTLRAVRDSFDQGNTLHTLQTERGGHAEPLYRRMGFEVDHTVAFFARTVSV